MAFNDPSWPYWYDAFIVQLLQPLSADILFTVGLLVVSEVFPPTTQALAGAVFSTVAQFGTSIGLTIFTVISASVGKSEKGGGEHSLLEGYRAGFYASFGTAVFACVIGGIGLRRMGKIGMKRD